MELEIKPLSDIIFKIGPRINASGRMQNGKASVSLLVERNYQKALEQAQQINQYNEERKELDKKMTEEAQELVKNSPDMENKSSIVIYNEDWHKGVIGIVASRLTETFYRPAVVLTRSDDLVTGSARSVSGFDVYKAIQSCADLMVNFGGHTYAAGLSLKVEDVAEFKQRFETYVLLLKPITATTLPFSRFRSCWNWKHPKDSLWKNLLKQVLHSMRSTPFLRRMVLNMPLVLPSLPSNTDSNQQRRTSTLQRLVTTQP